MSSIKHSITERMSMRGVVRATSEVGREPEDSMSTQRIDLDEDER